MECSKQSGGARQSVGGSSVRPITCFSCGKSGHRSVECPNKMVGGPVKKEVVTKKVSKIAVGGKNNNIAWGLVNGVRSRILIDSGAEVGVIPRSLVTKDSGEYGEVHICDVHGKTSVHQSTIVVFELGGLRCVKLAVIDE